VTLPELIALLPLIILAIGATALLMVARGSVGRTWPLTVGSLLALGAAVSTQLMPPYLTEIGGMYSAGPYARFFIAFWALATAATLISSGSYLTRRQLPSGEYSALLLFAAAGMGLLSSAVSLSGIFLALEAFTLVFYVLIAFNKDCPLGSEAGLKYLIPGGVAAGLLAFGMALLYAASGSMQLPAATAALLAGAPMQSVALAGMTLLLAAFAFKLSLAPFHFWTPDVYQGAPAPVTGLLASGSKGAVTAALLTLTATLPAAPTVIKPMLVALALTSMVVGTLCALAQSNVKRMLAYSSVVHMGFVLTGLLCWNHLGRSAALFYLVGYSIVTLGIFSVITSFSGEKEPQQLADYRGLAQHHPLRAMALTVLLLALAGLPPTVGFMGKLTIFSAALDAGYTLLAVVGILASVISIYFYLQPVIQMYMKPSGSTVKIQGHPGEYFIITLCLGLTLVFGLFPDPLLELIARFTP
jgi:NADH-quinone oxidoreductase subunit N